MRRCQGKLGVNLRSGVSFSLIVVIVEKFRNRDVNIGCRVKGTPEILKLQILKEFPLGSGIGGALR